MIIYIMQIQVSNFFHKFQEKKDLLHRTEVDHSQWSIFCLVKDPVSCSKNKGSSKDFLADVGNRYNIFWPFQQRMTNFRKWKFDYSQWSSICLMNYPVFHQREGSKYFDCCGRQTDYCLPFQNLLTPTGIDLSSDPRVWETF